MEKKDKIAIAKDFLRGYEREDFKVRMLEAEIKYLDKTIDSISAPTDGEPRGSDVGDKTGNMAIKLADKKLRLKEQKAEAAEKRSNIVDAIIKLSNARHTELLYHKYVELLSFEETAEQMHCDIRWVFRLANKAYEKIYEIIK